MKPEGQLARIALLTVVLTGTGCAIAQTRVPTENDIALMRSLVNQAGIDIDVDALRRVPDEFFIELDSLKFALALTESETLTVCQLDGDSHLEMGDVIVLTRIGKGPLRITHIPTDPMKKWQPANGNSIIVTPAIVHAQGKFNPLLTWDVIVPDHVNPPGNQLHKGFTMTRVIRESPNPVCNTNAGDEEVIISGAAHVNGEHHAGHAHLR
jgi:hypothetical protein